MKVGDMSGSQQRTLASGRSALESGGGNFEFGFGNMVILATSLRDYRFLCILAPLGEIHGRSCTQ
jgi:hypothetical protein